MKVGYIVAGRSPLFSPIGFSVHIRSFLDHFVKVGGEAFLIRKGSISERIDDIKIYNLRWIEGLPKLQKLCDLLYNFKLYLSAQSLIEKEKPDILHEREYYLNLSGLLLAKKLRIPYVLEVNCPVLYEARESFPLYREIHKAFERRLFERADKILAVSEAIKSYLMALGVTGAKIEVIPNGVDEKVFNPSISGQDVRERLGLTRKQIIGYAGSLHQEWQGLDDLLKAAQVLSLKKDSVVFLIVGGTESEIEEMKEMAPGNVKFTGRVDHSRVPEYLAASDILVAPYKREKELGQIGFYNSPIKLFEYMAMGKPIISSDIGQIGKILEHGKTALLVEPGNSEELAKNILSLVDEDELKRNLGQNARAEVEKKYTWERNARKVMEVYREVLESKDLPK